MKYEGVTFVEERVREMQEKDFIRSHIDVFWTDRDKKTRRLMLADVYRRIAGTK